MFSLDPGFLLLPHDDVSSQYEGIELWLSLSILVLVRFFDWESDQNWLSSWSPATLASSDDEQKGGLSPPPQKRARHSLGLESDMHKSKRTASGSDGETSTSNGECIANGDSKSHLKRKIVNRNDEDVVRLIVQHLQGLGLKWVSRKTRILVKGELTSFIGIFCCWFPVVWLVTLMFILFCASANQSMSLLRNQAVDSNIHPLQSLEKALWSVIGKGLVACHSICEFFFRCKVSSADNASFNSCIAGLSHLTGIFIYL